MKNTGEPRVWKLTRAVRGKAGGKGLSHRYLACCLSYYDLGERLPDHSSLTRIRERYGVEVFQRFFDAIVEQCQQEKLVWGRELYIDSTQVNANADLDSLTPRFAVEARAAMQAHLAALFAEEDSHQEPQPAETEVGDATQAVTSPEIVTCTVPVALPVILSQAEGEELAQDNAGRHDWITEEGRQQREVHGLYQRTSDFKVSTTDPDTTPMRLKGGGTHPEPRSRGTTACLRAATLAPVPALRRYRHASTHLM